MARTYRNRLEFKEYVSDFSEKEKILLNSDKYAYSWKKLGKFFKKDLHRRSRTHKKWVISNVLKSSSYDFDGMTYHTTSKERGLQRWYT